MPAKKVTALAKAAPTAPARIFDAYNDEQKGIIRSQICENFNDDEIAYSLNWCKARGFDPLGGRVHFWKGKDGKINKQIAIETRWAIAHETGEFDGQLGEPQWLGEDGKWYDGWPTKKPPIACKVVFARKGYSNPFTAVCYFDDYNRGFNRWRTSGRQMLLKCTESAGLTKAFPQQLGGTYSEEERWEEPLNVTHGRPDDDAPKVAAGVDSRKLEAKLESVVEAEPFNDMPDPEVTAANLIISDMRKAQTPVEIDLTRQMHKENFNQLSEEQQLRVRGAWAEACERVRPAALDSTPPPDEHDI